MAAATRMGAPMPSTTGTPSSRESQSGLMWTGHWLMPRGMMTSARSFSISERAAATKFFTTASWFAAMSGRSKPLAR